MARRRDPSIDSEHVLCKQPTNLAAVAFNDDDSHLNHRESPIDTVGSAVFNSESQHSPE